MGLEDLQGSLAIMIAMCGEAPRVQVLRVRCCSRHQRAEDPEVGSSCSCCMGWSPPPQFSPLRPRSSSLCSSAEDPEACYGPWARAHEGQFIPCLRGVNCKGGLGESDSPSFDHGSVVLCLHPHGRESVLSPMGPHVMIEFCNVLA